MSGSGSTNSPIGKAIATAGGAALGTAVGMKNPGLAVAGSAVGAAAPDVILYYGRQAREAFEALLSCGARDEDMEAFDARLDVLTGDVDQS